MRPTWIDDVRDEFNVPRACLFRFHSQWGVCVTPIHKVNLNPGPLLIFSCTAAAISCVFAWKHGKPLSLMSKEFICSYLASV